MLFLDGLQNQTHGVAAVHVELHHLHKMQLAPDTSEGLRKPFAKPIDWVMTDLKKGTGHLLLANCLNLRMDGNDSVAAVRRGCTEQRRPRSPRPAGCSSGGRGIDCQIGIGRQERAALAFPHGRVPTGAEVARVGCDQGIRPSEADQAVQRN